MARKILEVHIKTRDDKGHVNIWTARDVDLDSIKFNVDKVAKKEAPKKEEPKKESKSKKKK